jgi:flagellar protein FlaG
MEITSVNSSAAHLVGVETVRRPEQNAERVELIKAVRAVNESEMFGPENELTFVLDRETQRPLLRIVDRRTREVVRQIPPEYVVRMAEDLKRGELSL